MTVSATLPSRSRETPFRPWLPIATWSMSLSSSPAKSTMTSVGLPTSVTRSTVASSPTSSSISSNSSSARAFSR
jgi:hypothetical protein